MEIRAMRSGHASPRTRPPAVAGSFYPRSAEALSRGVAELLAAAKAQDGSLACGLIAPHAGYGYSGAVAAQAFASVRRLRGAIERALIVGPAHFVPFAGIAAPTHAAFTTPLGELPVDVAAVEALIAERLVALDDAPHAPDHSIEVELPFLQAIFGTLPIVPLLCGSTQPEAVAAVLARIWREDTLLIVSSDLSHFESYDRARRHDQRTAAAIEALDEAAIGPRDACGHLPIRGALREALRRGLKVERLALCNSGDTAGDRARVVGYGAWAFRSAAAHAATRGGPSPPV
jgi:AmmeMemoRadiSam system protein B